MPNLTPSCWPEFSPLLVVVASRIGLPARSRGGHLGLGIASSEAVEDVLNGDAPATESGVDDEYSQTLAQFNVNRMLIRI